MPKKERVTAQQVVEALEATQGLVYLAAERLAINARTVYKYAARHPIIREALAHHKGKRLDTAEAALWKAVLAGEAWAVCFYLKTQGKERGYVERQELRTMTEDELNGAIEAELARLAEDRAAAPAAAPAAAGNGECPLAGGPAGPPPLP